MSFFVTAAGSAASRSGWRSHIRRRRAGRPSPRQRTDSARDARPIGLRRPATGGSPASSVSAGRPAFAGLRWAPACAAPPRGRRAQRRFAREPHRVGGGLLRRPQRQAHARPGAQRRRAAAACGPVGKVIGERHRQCSRGEERHPAAPCRQLESSHCEWPNGAGSARHIGYLQSKPTGSEAGRPGRQNSG